MIKKMILMAVLVSACQSDPENEAGEVKTLLPASTARSSQLDQRTSLNISILIDLSDRIDPVKNPNPTMEYFQRDTGYIASVVNAFNRHVSSKKVILINDHISTFIDPLPQNPEIVRNLEELKVGLSRDNVTKEILHDLPQNYIANATNLYNHAISDNKYIGSDTYRFFKSNARDYCIKDNAHNVLVILTDGYMYHPNSVISEKGRRSYINKRTFTDFKLNTPAWNKVMKEKDFGFYQAPVDLTGLKVILLGLNPSTENPFEEDVLRAWWQKWLMEMGISEKDILIKRADLPVNLDGSIQDFILST